MSTRASIVIGGETITWRESPKQEINLAHTEASSKREWAIDGSLNRNSILTAIGYFLPAADLVGGSALFLDKQNIKEQGGGCWTLSADYRIKQGSWELSLDTSGGTTKRLQSYKTMRAYDATGNVFNQAPEDMISLGLVTDHKRAIGVTNTGVEGVDVVDPKFDFTVNYKFPIGNLSAGYLMNLYRMTGRMNDAPFALTWNGQSLTFAAGDLRFMGSQARQTSDFQLDITYRFSAMKGLAGGSRTAAAFTQPAINSTVSVTVGRSADFTVNTIVYVQDAGFYAVDTVTDPTHLVLRLLDEEIAVAGTVPSGSLISANDEPAIVFGDSDPIKKRGWDYLWAQYREKADAATGYTTRVPVACYVEQVVREANFQLFSLPA